MFDWLSENKEVLFWLGMLSIGTLVLAAVLLPVVVVRLPADYFVRRGGERRGRYGWAAWCWRVGKNLIGLVFVVAGIAMLVLPGQGLLTILIGLLMMDFPGKLALERRLIGQPKILTMINRLRERRGHPPLQLAPPAERGPNDTRTPTSP
jgi:MFS family permease